MQYRVVAVVAAVLASLTGTSSAPPLSAAPKVTTKVAALNAAGLKKQVAARKGKVVVVNYWATWCGPCVEEFPDLVRLQAKHKARGLDLVTVSFDEPGDAGPKVAPFLAKNKLATGTFIQTGKTGGDAEAFVKALEPTLADDAGIGIPRTYVFGRDGKLARVLIGGQSLATFEKAVAPLLAKR